MADNENSPASVNPQLQKKIQNFFNKGFAAFERGSLDMAIDLLYQCLELEPGHSRARAYLRSAALQRFTKGKASKLKIQLSEVSGLAAYLKASSLHKKPDKKIEALLASEKLIEQAPLVSKYVVLAAQCAIDAGYPDQGVMLFETTLQVDPGNEDIMRALATAFIEMGEFSKAREYLAALVAKHPQDGQLFSLLKDTEARATMKGSWDQTDKNDDRDAFRKLIKDKEQAEKLDMQGKSQVAANDVDALVAEQKAKIAKEPNNINYRRALARIYQQRKMYDLAAEALEEAKKISQSDPELDRLLSTIKTQAYDQKIAALRQSGDATAADALEDERNQFVFDDLADRVERYPNDLRLRYELGLRYIAYEHYDDAIQQFQLSQRSPKERTESLYGLAKCFRAKGQRDMAIMQLETAVEQLPVMNDTKKAVLFDLGELAEESGDIERAFKLYREVYGADIGYKDIEKKMERIYAARKASQA